MKNVLKSLAKSVLVPLGLTAAAAADTAIHKNSFGPTTCPSGLAKQATLIISSEEMNDIMKIVKSLEESDLLIKEDNKTIKNEAKKQGKVFLGISLSTLGASLLGNLLTGKGTIRGGEGTVRAGQNV